MTQNNVMCSYYTAHIPPEHVWFVSATLRSFEHVSFDRTIDVQKSIFEFFVPESTEALFCELMAYYISHEYVHDLQKKENRLLNEAELV